MKSNILLFFAMLFSIGYTHTAAENRLIEANPNRRERAEFAAGILIGMFAKDAAHLTGVPGATLITDLAMRSIAIKMYISTITNEPKILQFIKTNMLNVHELAMPFLSSSRNNTHFVYEGCLMLIAIGLACQRISDFFHISRNICAGIVIGYEIRRMHAATQAGITVDKKINLTNILSAILLCGSLMRSSLAAHQFWHRFE